MNDLERFKAVVNFQEPDYIPIFGFTGAPGVTVGCMKKTHQRLIDTGMPKHIGGIGDLSNGITDVESWRRYWGTTGPIELGFFPGEPAKGIQYEKRIEGDWEIVEYETGAVTRQVLDNDITYSMPEFKVYPIRDRKSWKVFMDLMTPGKKWPRDKIEAECSKYDKRDRPLSISVGGTWGSIRNYMGTDKASTLIYDDPGLLLEILDWNTWQIREYIFPLIERLKPEIIQAGEDICYKNGMLISPKHFKEFCSPFYTEISKLAKGCGADMIAIDTDGNAMEFVPIVEECGVNAIFPFEVKSDNDLFKLREKHPRFILMGWLEKEIIVEGNEHLIEQEVLSKVPPLLKKGGYFPNLDHGILPSVTFENLCKFMTLLHEITGNPEGDYPRMK